MTFSQSLGALTSQQSLELLWCYLGLAENIPEGPFRNVLRVDRDGDT